MFFVLTRVLSLTRWGRLSVMASRSRSAAAAASAASGSSSSRPASSSAEASGSQESLEALVLAQLVAAVRELQADWDEARRREFVVSVLHQALGGDAPDGNHSWPVLEDFSIRAIRGICTQLALEVVEGPRARHHMMESLQDSLWEHWSLQHPDKDHSNDITPESHASGAADPDAMRVDGSDSSSEEAGADAAAVPARAAPASGSPDPAVTRSSPRRMNPISVLKPFRPSARPRPALEPVSGLTAAQLAAVGALPSKPARPAVSTSKQRAFTGSHRRSSRRLFADVSASSSSSSSASDSDSPSSSSDATGSDSDWSPPTPPSRHSKRAHRKHRSADVSEEMESTGRAQPMAKEFIRNVLRNSGGTSVYRVFKYDVVFHSERNRRECLALSRILDAALAGDKQQLVELTVRRLAGVHTADSSDNNWDACDAIEQVMEKQSFVPTKFLQRTLRTVVQLQALQQRKPQDASSRSAVHSGHSRSNRGKRGPGEPGTGPPPGTSSGSKKGAAPYRSGGSSSQK